MAAVERAPSQPLSWIWVLCAGTASGGSAVLALALVGTLDMLVLHSESGSLTHGLYLSAWLVLWAALALVGIVLTTIVLRQPVGLSRTTLALTFGGIALAAVVQLSLQQWAAGRMIDYAHDMIGFTMIVPDWVVAITISAFALDQAPALARPWVRMGGLGCVAATISIIAMNVRGAADGIGPDSTVPAVLLVLISLYSVVTAIRLLRRPLGAMSFRRLLGGSSP